MGSDSSDGDHGTFVVGGDPGSVRVRRSRQFIYETGGPTMTKASAGFGLETQEIFERYYKTGQLEAWNQRPGRYGEWEGPQDLHQALIKLQETREHWEALPVKIRDYCEHDMVKFLELVHDPKREGELRELGLIPRGETPPPPAGSIPAPDPPKVPDPPKAPDPPKQTQ